MILDENFKIKRYGLCVRFVNENDAEFIVKLRTDPRKSRYIKGTSPDVEKQRKWIFEHKKLQDSGGSFYFMFEKPEGNRLTISRIYDVEENNFTGGSWLSAVDAPMGVSILAFILSYEIAFELFPEKNTIIDVKKKNVSVNRYVKSFGAELTKEEEDTNYYILTKENFEKNKIKYLERFYKA